jgi:hypothetical protein
MDGRGALFRGLAHVFGDLEGVGAFVGAGDGEADGAAFGDFFKEAAGELGDGLVEDEEGGGFGVGEERKEGVEAGGELVGGGGEPGHGGVEDDEGVVALGNQGAEFVEGFGEGEEGELLVVGDDAELFGFDGGGEVGTEAMGGEGDVRGGLVGEEEDLFADADQVGEKPEGDGGGAGAALAREEGGLGDVEALEEFVERSDAGFDLEEVHVRGMARLEGRGVTGSGRTARRAAGPRGWRW